MKSLSAWARMSLLAALTGCGGGQSDTLNGPALIGTMQVVSPLLDDEGGVLPTAPAQLPADPAARTRRAAHASPAQAEQLQAALGSRVARVEVSAATPGWHAVEAAVQRVRQHHAAQQLTSDAPVLVQGGDPHLAALVADELVEAGFTRVFLITSR